MPKRVGSVRRTGVPGSPRSFPRRLDQAGMLVVSDSATRADQGPPPSANWQTDPAGYGANGFTITSNQFAPTILGNNEMAWVPDVFGPDVDMAFDIPTLQLSTEVVDLEALNVWGATDQTGYDLQYVRGGGLNLFRADNGAYTTIATAAQELNPGDSLRLHIAPATVEGWVKSAGTWTQYISVADTTYRTTNVKVAVFTSSQTIRLDNFIATSGIIDVSAPTGTSYTDSGTIPVTIALAGADQVASTDSGTIPVTISLSGVDQVASIDSGAIATGTVTLSGADSQGANDTGTIPIGTVTITGADQVASTDSGTIPVAINLSGADRVGSTDNGAIPLTINLNGADLAVYGDSGQIPLTISVSGADQVASADSGAIPLTITISGVEQYGAFTGPGFDDIIDRRTNRVLPVP